MIVALVCGMLEDGKGGGVGNSEIDAEDAEEVEARETGNAGGNDEDIMGFLRPAS